MDSKQNWKTWLRTTAFVALAAFVAVGFTFATFDTAAADSIPWATEDSHIPQEALEVAWATEDSHIPQEALDSVFAVAAPRSYDSWDYYESYLSAIEQVESVLAANFDLEYWDYIREMESR